MSSSKSKLRKLLCEWKFKILINVIGYFKLGRNRLSKVTYGVSKEHNHNRQDLEEG